MLLTYGFSLAGRSHIEKGIPCQDAHIVCELHEGVVLCAIADGLGSAPRSDRGAQLALATLLAHCAEHFHVAEGPQAWLAMLCEGFSSALAAVFEEADAAKLPRAEYDCTLTAALYHEGSVYIGHCGDGGVIAIDAEGHYKVLTSVQKGEAWNEVSPLRAGARAWVFEACQGDVAGLLLLTDGLYDIALPSLLFGQEDPLYKAFVFGFLSGEMHTQADADALCARQMAFVQSESCAAITDDMTAVALLRTEPPVSVPDAAYLQEPDWQNLRQERYYKLYPHLRPQCDEPTEAVEEPWQQALPPEPATGGASCKSPASPKGTT